MRNTRFEPNEERILKAEVERLAKKVTASKGLDPDKIFYGLPLWVQFISPSAVGAFGKGNPLFDEFRNAVLEAFDLVEDSDSTTDGHGGPHK